MQRDNEIEESRSIIIELGVSQVYHELVELFNYHSYHCISLSRLRMPPSTSKNVHGKISHRICRATAYVTYYESS